MHQLQQVEPKDLDSVWQAHYNNLDATPIGKEQLAKYVASALGVSYLVKVNNTPTNKIAIDNLLL